MEKTASILLDSEKYEVIRKNAFDIAKSKYSWNAISKELEIVYRSIRKKEKIENRN